MDVLVLGGTVFLGRAAAEEARAAGARVTIFTRGKSGPAPEGVEHVIGDRNVPADLEQLAGRQFDIVVDTSGYVPSEVALGVGVLARTCGHYAFVSTINVFPGWPEQADYHVGGVHDGNPDAEPDEGPEDPSARYGWRKAGCELAVLRAFGEERSALLRAGSIVGPDDSHVGRLPWWIDRIARGGEVLAPGHPDQTMTLIDSRDVARFALGATAGTFEVAGAPLRRAEVFETCREVTGSAARFTWVSDEWLAAQDVQEWTEIPLWAAPAGAPSTFTHDTSAAEAAGLNRLPLRETIADTWAWQQSIPGGWQPSERTPGLNRDKEAALLASWHARHDG